MRHPECDLRSWLEGSPRGVSAYTAGRIAASYQRLEKVIGPCSDPSPKAAFDIGCGAGHESFALGTYFDQVLGVDTRRRSIREARGIARRTGASRVEFRRADAERWRSETSFTFVACNLMSHYGSSRLRLLNNLRTTIAPGGWLYYSEETEGYAPRDVEDAITRRDARQLRTRIRQVLQGFVGRPGFRFFLAGSADSQLTRLGLEITHRERETWGPLVAVDRVWCRAVEEPQTAPISSADPDYLAAEPEFKALRGHLQAFQRRRPRGGYSEADENEIGELAREPGNRLAPFLLFLLMADAVPLAHHGTAPGAARLLERSVLPGPGEPDWDKVAQLNGTFSGLLRRS